VRRHARRRPDGQLRNPDGIGRAGADRRRRDHEPQSSGPTTARPVELVYLSPSPSRLGSFAFYFGCPTQSCRRAPFDLEEAESELVAGFHTEYSGFRFSLFFLAEYANMITVSAMAVTLFWGGWLRPFPNIPALAFLDWIPPVLWFAAKVIVFLYFYLWFRASWPRYRYDQLMKLRWQFLLPISIANVILTAILVVVFEKG